MTTVVLLGMHRSGTSAVAGVLAALGVHMGDTDWEPNEYNPYGYHEDLEIVEANAALLQKAGGYWSRPPDEGRLQNVCALSQGAMAEMIARKDTRPLWGWKDPRTCLTARFWHPFLTDPRYVWVQRQERDVIRSLQKRSIAHAAKLRALICAGEVVGAYARMDLDEATWGIAPWRDLVREYERRVGAFIEAVEPACHIVQYEDLVNRRRAEERVRRLAEFVRVPYDESALGAIHWRA